MRCLRQVLKVSLLDRITTETSENPISSLLNPKSEDARPRKPHGSSAYTQQTTENQTERMESPASSYEEDVDKPSIGRLE